MSATKKQIIDAFIAHFESELKLLEQAVSSARDAATHEEAKSEDKHDTRGIEASYLAGAQAARAEELKQVILDYKLLAEEATLRAASTVAVGALLAIQPLENEKPKGRTLHSLFALRGGGATVTLEGQTYSVVTPTSPLGEALLGASAGEEVEIESKAGLRTYLLISVH